MEPRPRDLTGGFFFSMTVPSRFVERWFLLLSRDGREDCVRVCRNELLGGCPDREIPQTRESGNPATLRAKATGRGRGGVTTGVSPPRLLDRFEGEEG